MNVANPDSVAGVDQDGEAGDSGGFHSGDFEIGDAFGEDSVVGGEAGEHGFGRRKAEGAGDGVAVAVEREVVEFDVFARRDHDQRAAAEGGGGFDCCGAPLRSRSCASDGQHDFARYFDHAGGQGDGAGFG